MPLIVALDILASGSIFDADLARRFGVEHGAKGV
jgi:hypothetical protein